MLLAEQKRVQARRDAKAALLREGRRVRGGGLPNRALRMIARQQHGESQRVEPETLGDYWPVQSRDGVLATQTGDAESWAIVYLCPPDWTDEDIYHELGVCEHYGGPGRGFSRHPSVERSRFHVLVRWSGGLDI